MGAVAGMFLGRHIDSGNGVRMTALALGSYAFLIALRAAALKEPILAVAANALASVGSCLYAPTLMTAVYNQAQRAPCTLRFHVATEGGWDIGAASGLLIAALLISLGVPFPLVLLLPLIGLAAAFVQLNRYYAGLGPKRRESTRAYRHRRVILHGRSHRAGSRSRLHLFRRRQWRCATTSRRRATQPARAATRFLR